MNRREMFEIWKRHKERLEVSVGFPERVMAHIEEHQAAQRNWVAVSASLLKRMAARPWAKAAVVVLGVLTGLVRIAVTLDFILRV